MGPVREVEVVTGISPAAPDGTALRTLAGDLSAKRPREGYAGDVFSAVARTDPRSAAAARRHNTGVTTR